MSDPFNPNDDMSEYLQIYLDETAEQLDALVEALLYLENDPVHAEQLNEAFRLIHSIKGSSGLMGFDSITVLTHQLENHFERMRSGMQRLDRPMMGLILRCIDFLRECNRRLRAGIPLVAAPELLEELNALRETAVVLPPAREHHEAAPIAPPKPVVAAAPRPRDFRVTLRFESGLSLVELKAELVLARIGRVGVVLDTLPKQTDLADLAESLRLQILLKSDRPTADIRAAADADGVELIEVEEGVSTFAVAERVVAAPITTATRVEPTPTSVPIAAAEPEAALDEMIEPAQTAAAAEPEASEAKSKVAETVRVDIDRLDNLMNLAGELVVNKARFVQIVRQMSPAFKKSNLSGRARAIGETMRRALQTLRSRNVDSGDTGKLRDQLSEMEAEVRALEEQSKQWDDSRRYFGQITEAIDQLTRVSDSLQRGVLDTRMVPVAPLFNRFKRVVRDISLELKKKVNLEIHGEKTELDKRMIDELGDPLVHLVRNAIDHGLEQADVRVRRGKPETGTLRLEAAHSGNNVFIYVRDDGGGIDAEKIRQRIVARNLVSETGAAELTERELVDFIWHPGFSTAEAVSDISGRGVGMDIVKTRIAELNGTIDVQSSPGQGSTFTIRLPLTLAIIRSLLFHLRHGMFAVPIDNVREIVSVPLDQIITIHGRQTFDVRGQFIPLVDINDIFEWHDVHYDYAGYGGSKGDVDAKRVNVVILHSADKVMGLRVNELHGGQDIVIKSLAENFAHIRGLSGASILGDGSVCLLLDVGAAIAMASDSRRERRLAG